MELERFQSGMAGRVEGHISRNPPGTPYESLLILRTNQGEKDSLSCRLAKATTGTKKNACGESGNQEFTGCSCAGLNGVLTRMRMLIPIVFYN
ncbi:MAG: hypothetical protein Q8904_08135 [Bacteroidota bacterium]|nr:hypothetical protein [Bacteroidota bacterium]